MAMVLAVVHLRLNVVQAASLKDKRRVVKSFKDRVRASYNVSVAEVGDQDNWRWCTMAIAMVGSDRRYVESAVGKIVKSASTHRDMLLAESQVEWL